MVQPEATGPVKLDRLRGVYPDFSDDVIRTVEDVAGKQAFYGDECSRYFKDINLPVVQRCGESRAQIMDFDSEHRRAGGAIVSFVTMANGLDPNQQFQAATIAEAMPNKRFIVVGNTGAGIYAGSQLHKRSDRKKVARGNFTPLVDDVARYIEDQDIQEVTLEGYSLGATLALELSNKDATNTSKVLVIEPADITRNSVSRLGLAFVQSGGRLEEYVKKSQSLGFEAARKNSPGMLPYAMALLKPTNIAEIRGLTKGRFEARVDKYLGMDQDNEVTVIRGSESELALNGVMRRVAERLSYKHSQRYIDVVLSGQAHALVNDIYLGAALVRQFAS